MATTDLAPSLADWERMEDPPSGRLEVLDGKVIVSAAPRLIHQIVVQALAAEFDRQCPPGLKAVFDVEWRKLRGQQVEQAPRPDIVVLRLSEVRGAAALTNPPVLAVEVLSPSNRPAELDRKRSLYLEEGLRHYAEITIEDDESRVTLDWYRAGPSDWELAATAAGEDELVVAEPFPFRVVPNRLLPWS